MAAGDAVVAIALAGSLFFDISPDAARGKVALYLLFTMLPFAIVAPLVGPALDRITGGRRVIVVPCAAGKAVVSVFMITHLDGLALFPLAFVTLVLSKAYAVSKSALVPSRRAHTRASWSRPTRSSAWSPASSASSPSSRPSCCS